MSQQTVLLPNIGEVLLSKRRGAKYLRLSINAKGQVRVGIPYWVPYSAGIAFVRDRQDWIRKQLESRPQAILQHDSRIGKAHRLYFYPSSGRVEVRSRVTATEIAIYTDLPHGNKQVQSKAKAASERALFKESTTLLPQRLKYLAEKHGYSYRGVKIRKLTSRWGSCSSQKIISLSCYLVQLPWPMIDYVLLHELAHTKELNHGANFWTLLNRAIPHAKQMQKEIRAYRPQVEID